MSKIVPKSMQSQSSQNIKSNQHRNENTEREVIFAALFGGATGEVSTEESLIGKASMTNLMSADSSDNSPFGGQTSDNLMTLLRQESFHTDDVPALQSARGQNSYSELSGYCQQLSIRENMHEKNVFG